MNVQGLPVACEISRFIRSLGKVSIAIWEDLLESLTFPAASEEHLDDKDLEASHGDHQSALDQAEVENSPLRTPHRAEVAVLTRAEVFLLPGQVGDLTAQLPHVLFHPAELLGARAGLLR